MNSHERDSVQGDRRPSARCSSLCVLALLVPSLWFAATRAAAEEPPPPPEYKVAFWYRRSDPLNTFRHQVYDLRKGQYTGAVDDWLRRMQADHPDYVAYVKEIRLDPDSGEAEKKQLATAILRENLDRGGPNGGSGVRDPYGIYGGVKLGDLMNPGVVPERPRPTGPDPASLYSRGYGFVNSPGANRPPRFLSSPGQTLQGIPSPFPYPYVRPHP
jgi:hypothetical protein